MQRVRGMVAKWMRFHRAKDERTGEFINRGGFGFIRVPCWEKDVFVHNSALAGTESGDPYRSLNPGQCVDFIVQPNSKPGKDGWEAIDVKVVRP